MASAAIQRGDVPAKLRAVDKAISIIGQGLQASLDHQRGGEIAAQLNGLYDYMLRRLLLANATNDVGVLAEVDGLLVPLQEAWASIGQPGAVNSHLSVVS
jgi:flagellar protein FliS